MTALKKYVRNNTTLAEIIILLIGLIVIMIGKYFGNNICIGIGTSVLSSAIIVFMTDVMIGTGENETVKRWGLENIYKTRGEMNSACDVYLKKAKRIDIIAFGLKSFRDSQQNQVKRILKNGGTIRIITMQPYCKSLKKREQDELQPEDSISYTITQLTLWAQKNNNNNWKGKIEIKYHDHQPLDFMFMMDNRLFTGPYEYGKNSQQSLSFEYKNNSDAYDYYKNYFEELWKDEDFCSNTIKNYNEGPLYNFK